MTTQVSAETGQSVWASGLGWLAALVASAGTLAAGDVGKDWGVERSDYVDPVTQARIWELTSGANTADNLYFHFSNFTADHRHLLFVCKRAGQAHLFQAEVETGRLVQLTDDPAVAPHSACPDPADARRVYYLRGAEVWVMDRSSLAARRVGEIPPPHTGGFQPPTLSGDGRTLAVGKQRDAANWEVGVMDVATGAYRTVVSQGFRIGHVQHSPTAPVIFYVWETGGYAPQRSWLVNTDGSGNRPFYVRTDPKTWLTPLKEWLTHEAWVPLTGEMTMINDKVGILLVGQDGLGRLVREGNYWHCAARHDGKFIVADDSQGRVWLIQTDTGNVRLLATGLRDTIRSVHAHPSFDRQGRYVQFHTGRTRETVALLDLTQLPPQTWVP